MWGISSQPLLTLDEEYLLMAAPPYLECGVAPLDPPEPVENILRALEIKICPYCLKRLLSGTLAQ